jgi:CCR4-NOT transcriptional regulation complex NOT5 subunit
MSLLATAAATAIAAASAAAAVGTFFAYLYFARRSEAHAAREEAIALAETRGEVIVDLRQRLVTLERRLKQTTIKCENRVRELERALERMEAEAREHAYRMQRFYAASLSDLLRGVQADLETKPPNVEEALARIRELLDGERPAA